MAEKRMFAQTIIDSDAFLDMPITARLLYYDLSMRADDDGFVNSPKKIMRVIGASEDDLRVLAAKKFIIPFETGIVVIKHWKIHNYIRKDMYHETKYKDEKSMLELDENNAYRMRDAELLQPCNEYVTIPDTQNRLDKNRLDKNRLDKNRLEEISVDKNSIEKSKRFTPPSLDEVKDYIWQQGYSVDAEVWFHYYMSNGWMVGRTKMKDWKSCIAQWNAREKKNNPEPKPQSIADKWANA